MTQTTRLELIKRIIQKQEKLNSEQSTIWLDEVQSLGQQIDWIKPLILDGKIQLKGPTERLLYREPEPTEEFLLLGILRGAKVFDLVEDLAQTEEEEIADESY
jgi:hypothetical protein